MAFRKLRGARRIAPLPLRRVWYTFIQRNHLRNHFSLNLLGFTHLFLFPVFLPGSHVLSNLCSLRLLNFASLFLSPAFLAAVLFYAGVLLALGGLFPSSFSC